MTRSTEKLLAEIRGSKDALLRKIERIERLKVDLEKALRWERATAKRLQWHEDARVVEAVLTALHDQRRRGEPAVG